VVEERAAETTLVVVTRFSDPTTARLKLYVRPGIYYPRPLSLNPLVLSFYRQEMPMETDARLYHCVLCHRQVLICSVCDRGNIYCDPKCSAVARRQSLRKAAKQYQQTYPGRLKHAARQHCYRARQKEKVTHQGSQQAAAHSPSQEPDKPINPELSVATADLHCHFCTRRVLPFIRSGFVRHASGIRRSAVTGCAQGP